MTLEKLRTELSACRYCEEQGIIPEARPVFQLPDSARIGLFSQAPGNLAHREGRPFMDPSGVRLRQWMGVSEEEFYTSGRIAIAPMAFCFPGYDGKSPTGKGGDLPPPKVCAERWRERVMAEIEGRLKLVLLVGAYAQRWHLGNQMGRTLTETVRMARDRITEGQVVTTDAPVFLPLPHPSWRNNAWLRRNTWFEEDIVPYMQAIIRNELG